MRTTFYIYVFIRWVCAVHFVKLNAITYFWFRVVMYTKISVYWFVFNPNCLVERSWFIYLFTGVKHDFASPVEHVLLTVSKRGSSRRALSEVGAVQSVVFCVVFCRPLSIISPIFF